MLQRSLTLLLALFIPMFVVLSSAAGQDDTALLGKWSMTSETDGDPVHWTLVLKETNGKLIATLATDEAETPAKEFTYEGGVLKFRAPYQGEYYDIELKLVEAKLDGTWSGGGGSGKTSGTKSS